MKKQPLSQFVQAILISALLLFAAPISAKTTLREANQAMKAEDFSKAIKIWKELAQRNEDSALQTLGFMHLKGQGVEVSIHKAWYWHERAIHKNEAYGSEFLKYNKPLLQPYLQQQYQPAQIERARLSAKFGSTEIRQKALAFLERLATKGSARAQYELVKLARGKTREETWDIKKAWAKKSADQGFAPGQYIYGNMLRIRSADPEKDKKRFQWAQKAANQGYAPAQATLGKLYRDGKGVEKSDEKALLFLNRAAEQGSPEAMLDLGSMYEHGWGVQADAEKALSLFNNAKQSSGPKKKIWSYALTKYNRLKKKIADSKK